MQKKYDINSFVAGNCYSYLISDNTQALIIDPHISLVEKYSKSLRSKSLSLVGIFDTHTHADHLSSAAILKKKYDVPVYMSQHTNSSVATARLKDGDVIKVGNTNITAIYTPGHTDDSVSLLAEHGDLFTGDVLLINSVGRTDFQNGSPEDMFDSIEKLAALADEIIVRPAHDYQGNKTSTIAEQKLNNPFVLEKDKTKFCDYARSKKLPKPANMDTIITANLKGSAEQFTTIPAKEAFEKLSQPDTILLDVRTAQELTDISVKLDNIKHIALQSLASSMSSLSNQKSYYILCKTGNRSTMAAASLIENGFPNIAVIQGGMIAWEKANLPINKTPGPISLERQVRIIAGCLILIGSLLSLVNIWFIIIPIWVGSGLLFAGISDNCMMGLLLMKLPYNKKAISGSKTGTCSI